tara:strand:+ start:80 stop:1000 length:921 start_codon:yes stop_codon:yes gene_type:complete
MVNGTDPEKELTPSQQRKAIRKSNKLAAYKRKAGEKEARMQGSVDKALDPNYSLIGSAKDKIKSAASTIKTDLDAIDRHKIKADLQTAFPKVSKDIQSITKRKVADDLRTAFTPNTDVKVENISEGAHAGQVKKTKTKYKTGPYIDFEGNIKKKKTTYNPPTATKTTGKKITHKSNVGESYSKTKYFKHGKAKGQVKKQFKETVTGKDVNIKRAEPGLPKFDAWIAGKGSYKGTTSNKSFTSYDKKGNIKVNNPSVQQRKKAYKKPTQSIKKFGQDLLTGTKAVSTPVVGVMGVPYALLGQPWKVR